MFKFRSLVTVMGIALLAALLVACSTDDAATAVPPSAPDIPDTPVPAATAASTAPEPTAVGPAPTSVPVIAPTPIVITPTPQPDTKVVPEGTLTILSPSLKGLPAAGIPFNGPGGIRRDYVHYTFDTPLWTTPEGAWFGRLAESWEIAADGSSLTFKIRQGIPFHNHRGDWGEVTAEDLKWSLENAGSSGSSHIRSSAYRLIKSYEIPDPYTLKLEVNPQEALLMQGSMGPYRGIGVASKAYIDSVGEDTAGEEWVGTGPWRHVKTRPGESLEFEAVDGHHFKTPVFKNLVVLAVPETASQIAAIRAGEADMSNLAVNFLPEVQAAGLKVITAGEGGGQVRIKLGGQHLPSRAGTSNPGCPGEFDLTCGEFNTDAAPWIGDPNNATDWGNALKVREAMTLAVDKQEIWETVYEGVGRVAVIEQNSPDFRQDLFPAYGFDPTRAKQLLTEAGYPNGFEFNLVFEVEDFAEDLAAQAVQQMYNDVGITMHLKAGIDARPASVDRTFGTVEAEADLGRGSSAYEETFTWWQGKSHSLTDNLSTAEHTFLDQTSDLASITFDSAEREKLNLEIQQFLYDSYFSIPIVYLPILVVAGPKIGDYPYPFGGRSLPGISFVTKAK